MQNQAGGVRGEQYMVFTDPKEVLSGLEPLLPTEAAMLLMEASKPFKAQMAHQGQEWEALRVLLMELFNTKVGELSATAMERLLHKVLFPKTPPALLTENEIPLLALNQAISTREQPRIVRRPE